MPWLTIRDKYQICEGKKFCCKCEQQINIYIFSACLVQAHSHIYVNTHVPVSETHQGLVSFHLKAASICFARKVRCKETSSARDDCRAARYVASNWRSADEMEDSKIRRKGRERNTSDIKQPHIPARTEAEAGGESSAFVLINTQHKALRCSQGLPARQMSRPTAKGWREECWGGGGDGTADNFTNWNISIYSQDGCAVLSEMSSCHLWWGISGRS